MRGLDTGMHANTDHHCPANRPTDRRDHDHVARLVVVGGDHHRHDEDNQALIREATRTCNRCRRRVMGMPTHRVIQWHVRLTSRVQAKQCTDHVLSSLSMQYCSIELSPSWVTALRPIDHNDDRLKQIISMVQRLEPHIGVSTITTLILAHSLTVNALVLIETRVRNSARVLFWSLF